MSAWIFSQIARLALRTLTYLIVTSRFVWELVWNYWQTRIYWLYTVVSKFRNNKNEKLHNQFQNHAEVKVRANRNRMTLHWVPGKLWITKWITDEWRGSLTPYIGPEPALGLPKSLMDQEIFGRSAKMMNGLIYVIEYNSAMSINGQQLNTYPVRIIRNCRKDRSDVIIALEELFGKYLGKDKIPALDCSNSFFCGIDDNLQ